MRTMQSNTKTCLQCGATYKRPASYRSHKGWAARKYCGQACRARAALVDITAQPSKACAVCARVFYKPVGVRALSVERWVRQRTCSRSCGGKMRASEAKRRGELGHGWKRRPDYSTLHSWARRSFGEKTACALCEATGNSRQLQWANISGRYLRERSDWVCLCSRCHKALDSYKWVLEQSNKYQKRFSALVK